MVLVTAPRHPNLDMPVHQAHLACIHTANLALSGGKNGHRERSSNLDGKDSHLEKKCKRITRRWSAMGR